MQEWRKELSRKKPDELQELNKDTYIQRRNIKPYEHDLGNGETESGYSCECRTISKAEYAAMKEQENKDSETSDNFMTTMEAQAAIYEKLVETENNQLIIMQAIAEMYEAQKGEN
mgnify:CR=1 FL=1|jgi:hypothetical protein